jgi:hypothetical protein
MFYLVFIIFENIKKLMYKTNIQKRQLWKYEFYKIHVKYILISQMKALRYI